MALTDYISPNETILLSFRQSLSYYLSQIIGVWVLFGGGAVLYANVPVISGLLVGIGLLLTIYLSVLYWTERYFVTETKIYKKTGLVWRKLVGAKKDEITDFTILQGLFERLFGVGSIKINTSGTFGFEIMITRVSRPFQKKQQIQAAWGE